MTTINRGRIFSASCVALVVTAMTLGVRAGIMTELAMKFDLTDVQLGWIAGMAFLGFPVATMVGGLIYNFIGPKKLMYIAFAGHLLGLILTITASGFWTLIISTFCIGFANGSVEAACNPLIADIYHKNKTTMLNRFHVWFPGGIVIGALMSAGLSQLGMGWEIKIAIMLLPTIVYGYMIFGQTFPEMENTEVDTAINLRALFTPLYIFMLICMTLTATTELGTQQWIERILGNSGAHPMLILAMVTGLMAVGRYFAGPIIHAFNPAGVLLFSAIMAFLGIYLMSIASGPLVYAAAIIFALGVTYFWPTMIGFIGENCPKTGALGMSLIGGVGMFSVSMWSPVIGGWLESARADALANGLVGEAAELAAGQSTLANISLFPIVLIVLFTGLLIYKRKFASK
ncbi:MFS transporter [Saccharophagus degradans]|uniref:MFS transporter n=1 Tax=Saccharophagus degradans TaxID=86304 RepID=A0AAW7X956_9GAMM|nr:MFS transporter [Saccharophagus degradans]MBU2984123.1 MFS transporter [Saccharophagus degradans]MDO6424218.1 MFS transporter [Saccharophagus degradans]MDO6608265.1 MFS transporter [Saccharophagus degradans]WGO96793.1 MFS transporter [Saccharophagus degradans]